MTDTPFKYTISWGLGPFEQFAEGMKFAIQADHQEELKNGLDRLFGEGTFDRVSGRLARATFERESPSTPAAGAVVPGPVAAPAVASAPTSVAPTQAQYYGACPECGVGQIVDKYKRGTGEHFGRGCNNYPTCQYMASWDRPR